MKKQNYWVTSAFYTLMQRAITILLGVGSFAILVRVLPRKEFGVWAIFITVTSLIEVARIGFVQNALIKFLAPVTDKDEYKEVVTASVALNAILTALTVVVCLISAKLISIIFKAPVLEPMLYYYCFTTVSVAVLQHSNFLQQANLDFKGFFFSNLARQGSFFGIVLYYYIVKTVPGTVSLVHGMTVSAISGALTSLVTGRKFFSFSATVNRGLVKKLFHFGKFVFGTNISSMLYTGMDQMMLGILMPSSASAVFNTANRFNNFIDAPVSAVAAIVFPQSAKRSMEPGNESVRYLYEKSVGALIAILLPFAGFLILFAKPLIRIVAGSGYSDAVPAMIIITAAAVFQPFIRQFGVIMDSIGKPRENFNLLLMITAFNIPVSWFAIRYFGVTGAAWSSFTLSAVFALAALLKLKKEISVRYYAPFIYGFNFYKDAAAYLSARVLRKSPAAVI